MIYGSLRIRKLAKFPNIILGRMGKFANEYLYRYPFGKCPETLRIAESCAGSVRGVVNLPYFRIGFWAGRRAPGRIFIPIFVREVCEKAAGSRILCGKFARCPRNSSASEIGHISGYDSGALLKFRGRYLYQYSPRKSARGLRTPEYSAECVRGVFGTPRGGKFAIF